MVVCIIMDRVALLLLWGNIKIMTKFQFHCLIALGFLILSEQAVGFTFHIYWLLTFIFTVFAIFDIIKIAHEENLKNQE